MAVDERHRHALHEAARRALGEEAALTLMEMLPPVGWADVATKHDLDQLADRFDARLSSALAQLQLRLVLWFVGTGVAVVGATGLLRFA